MTAIDSYILDQSHLDWKKLHCLAGPMLLRVSALGKRPRDADAETRDQRSANAKVRSQKPVDTEAEDQKINSKSRKSRQRDQDLSWKLNR